MSLPARTSLVRSQPTLAQSSDAEVILPEVLRIRRSVLFVNYALMMFGTCRGQSSLQQLIGKNPTDFKKHKKGVQARRKAFADNAAKDTAAAESSELVVPELNKQPSSRASADLPSGEPSSSNAPAKRQRLASDSPKDGKVQCPVCKRFLDAAIDVNSHIGKILECRFQACHCRHWNDLAGPLATVQKSCCQSKEHNQPQKHDESRACVYLTSGVYVWLWMLGLQGKLTCLLRQVQRCPSHGCTCCHSLPRLLKHVADQFACTHARRLQDTLLSKASMHLRSTADIAKKDAGPPCHDAP